MALPSLSPKLIYEVPCPDDPTLSDHMIRWIENPYVAELARALSTSRAETQIDSNSSSSKYKSSDTEMMVQEVNDDDEDENEAEDEEEAKAEHVQEP